MTIHAPIRGLSDPDLMRQQALIGGRWVDADSGATVEVTDPATGRVLGSVPDMSGPQTRAAIEAAVTAFATWRRRPSAERSALLMAWHDLMEIDYCWGGLVGATQDRHPRAGEADGVFYAGGYSGHGAQLSTLMGQALAAMATGDAAANPLDGIPWSPVPMHWARRFTLPIIGGYYRLKDALP